MAGKINLTANCLFSASSYSYHHLTFNLNETVIVDRFLRATCTVVAEESLAERVVFCSAVQVRYSYLTIFINLQ